METRMEKYALLRAQIQKEIELDQEIRQVNSIIDSYLVKLGTIDPHHFQEIRQEFEQDFSWEKVFLDKNPEEQVFSPNFRYDLQQLLAQVKKETLESTNIIMQNEKNNSNNIMYNLLVTETLLNKPMYQKYQEILEKILEDKILYQEQITSYNENIAQQNITSSNINFAMVAQIRQKDNRDAQKMLKAVSNALEERQTVFLSNYRKFKNNWKILFALTVILMVILVITLLLTCIL